MPHCLVEYTDNLATELDVPVLLRALADRLCDSDGLFPAAGVRVRAYRLTDYALARGGGDDAFVHLTVKIGRGRSAEVLDAFFTGFFEVLKTALAPISQRRGLAISLYVETGGESGSYKHNNLHQRLGRAT